MLTYRWDGTVITTGAQAKASVAVMTKNLNRQRNRMKELYRAERNQCSQK